jgi:hypothetical protein
VNLPKRLPECRRARDTFWDVQVAKMTALGDSLYARIRPAVAAVPDSPLVMLLPISLKDDKNHNFRLIFRDLIQINS